MNLTELYSVLNISELVIIAALSALIAYRFHKTQDGKLRILMRNLFTAKVWVYGGSAIMIGLFEWWPKYVAYFRPLIVGPMVIIMIQLYFYIKKLDNSTKNENETPINLPGSSDRV